VTVCSVLVNEKTNNYTTKGQGFASGVVMTIYVITAVMTQCLHQPLPVNVVLTLVLFHLYITPIQTNTTSIKLNKRSEFSN
jgi:hypothetical protein